MKNDVYLLLDEYDDNDEVVERVYINVVEQREAIEVLEIVEQVEHLISLY